MRTITAALAALAALLLVACGSDKGPSKAEYIKKGNAICAKYDKQINAAAAKIGVANKKPTVPQIQAFARTSSPLLKQEIDKLKALKRPKDDKAKLDTIYAEADKALGGLVVAGADPKVAALLLKSDPFAKPNKLARDYGLSVCGASN